jgi:hypothetical protein
MRSAETRLVLQRLRNQGLAGSSLRTAADVVSSLGAVQAQDYPAARWAVGQRATALSDASVQQAVDEGAILRTHVLRPTWHFVTPTDIRWMLKLTAPRVKASCGFYHRQAGLDGRVFAKSQVVIARALEGGRHLTRKELGTILARAGIKVTGTPLGHVMLQAELDAVVCNGAQRGKQLTYALVDERAPVARDLARDEALAELTRRYFQSHGPAMVGDFVWWSGLTVRDAVAGIAMVTPALVRHSLGDREYLHVATSASATRLSPAAYLLPNFDEYTVAYRDRRLVIAREGRQVIPSSTDVLGHVIVIDGQVVGTWKRTLTPGTVSIDARLYRSLTGAETRHLTRAAERYGRFLNTPIELSTSSLARD